MSRYVWTVQPLMGRFGDPAEIDWTVLQGTRRLRGIESQAQARDRAIQMARDAAEDLPPGSELVVALADFPFGPTPDVEFWRMTTASPTGRTKRRSRPR
jgi:hypothetical protein